MFLHSLNSFTGGDFTHETYDHVMNPAAGPLLGEAELVHLSTVNTAAALGLKMSLHHWFKSPFNSLICSM